MERRPGIKVQREEDAIPYGWFAVVLVGLLVLYSAFWTGLVMLGWIGMAPARILQLDVANALPLVPQWARLALLAWTALLLVALVRTVTRRSGAAFWLAGAIVPHLMGFVSLSSNPYYDGSPGYVNVAVEIFAVFWLSFRDHGLGGEE